MGTLVWMNTEVNKNKNLKVMLRLPLHQPLHLPRLCQYVGSKQVRESVSVVLGLGLRTPVAAQAKSNTKGGGNKTCAKQGS